MCGCYCSLHANRKIKIYVEKCQSICSLESALPTDSNNFDYSEYEYCAPAAVTSADAVAISRFSAHFFRGWYDESIIHGLMYALPNYSIQFETSFAGHFDSNFLYERCEEKHRPHKSRCPLLPSRSTDHRLCSLPTENAIFHSIVRPSGVNSNGWLKEIFNYV